MKTVISVILALLILAGLSACTQNNGHIGKRFGMWKLLSIEIDGQKDTGYTGDMFWMFQTGVIEMQQSGYYSCFGRCTEEGDKMILDFNNHDDINGPGSALYTPLPQTHLSAMKTITLSILKMTRTEMKLLWHGDDDKAYIYTFKKWG